MLRKRQSIPPSAPLLLSLALTAFGCTTPEEPDPPAAPPPISEADLDYTEVQPEHPVSAVVDAKIRAALKIIAETGASSATTPGGAARLRDMSWPLL